MFGSCAGVAVAGTAFPVHGNWCGPNHGGGVEVDPLDAACRRHDLCVLATRARDCGCDLLFMDALRRMSWSSQALARKSRALHTAIALVPCVGTEQQRARKRAWRGRGGADAVVTGRDAPGAAFGRMMRLIGTGLANAYQVPE